MTQPLQAVGKYLMNAGIGAIATTNLHNSPNASPNAETRQVAGARSGGPTGP